MNDALNTHLVVVVSNSEMKIQKSRAQNLLELRDERQEKRVMNAGMD